MALEIGAIVEAKVSNVMDFGAFVSLPENKTGLIHISEIASDYVKDIHEHIKTGDVVRAKIIKIDEKGKISLSIKKAEAPKRTRKQTPQKPQGPVRPIDVEWIKPQNEDLSFEDKLSRFKQDSDEKMQALRRSNDSKRSGGYRRGGGSF